MAPKRTSIINFKGGTGKTTLAINISHALARKGERVLLIDCDLQGNAGSIIPPNNRGEASLTQVLKGQAQFEEAIYSARENLDILPSDTDLDTAANHITATGARAFYILRNAIKRLNRPYTRIIFDHSPSYSPITESTLLASDDMLIPCELAPFAVTGLLEMINKLTETLGGLDHEVGITGIVPIRIKLRSDANPDHQARAVRYWGELTAYQGDSPNAFHA
jgi:chromosome partitioning protein